MNHVSAINGPARYAYLSNGLLAEPRFKLYGERVTLDEFEGVENNINELTPEEINKQSKWVNDYFADIDSYNEELNNLSLANFSEEKIKEHKTKLNNAISISEGASQWGYLNKKFGGIGTKAVALSLLGSIGKIVLNLFESDNKSLKLICNLWEGVLLQIRNFVMYFLVYGGDKDDKGKNVFEAEKFNDKPLKILAKSACFSEIILGWIRPALLFFGEKTQKIIEPLISLPAFAWWRGRTGADFGHGFLGDFFLFLIHKPLSPLGIKSSQKIIKEINERDFLSKRNILEKSREHIGIEADKSNESISGRFFQHLKGVFNTNKSYRDRADASIKIAKLFSPFAGLYSFFALTTATLLKSILKYFDKENKFLDSFQQSGTGIQHIRYIFHFAIPEYFRNQNLKKEELKSEEFNKLKQNRNKLFTIGLSVCSMNVFSIGLKLFRNGFENKYLKAGIEIYDTLCEKGLSLYLSFRRHLKGEEDRLIFSEQYNKDETQKIISDFSFSPSVKNL